MEIRHSTEEDVPRIMEIYAYARRFMAEHGNPNQWGATNWPPESLIRADIAAGSSFVCVCDGRVVGTFFFCQGEDVEPTYRVIEDGAWLDDSPYGVVHRVAGDGSEKGIGSFCIEWAFAQCGHLRMDTHGDNRVMQNLLKKLGFVHCGTIHVEEDDDPRLAYEKLTDQNQRLKAFENMLTAVQKNYKEAEQKMAALKAQGKEKTATYRQLMGQKLQYQNMLSLYQVYGLLDGK